MPPRWCRGSWTEGPRFRWRSPARSSRPAAAKRTGMRRSGCWRCWRRVEMASPRPNRTARGRCCRCASDAAGPARTDAAAGAALGGDADLGVRFPRLCGLRRDGAGDDRALSAGRRRIGSRRAAFSRPGAMGMDGAARRRAAGVRRASPRRAHRHHPRRRAVRGAALHPPALAPADRARRAPSLAACAAAPLRGSGPLRRADVRARLPRLRGERHLGARAHAPALRHRGGPRPGGVGGVAQLASGRDSGAAERPRGSLAVRNRRSGVGVLHLPASHHRRAAARFTARPGRWSRRPRRPFPPRHHRRRPASGAARAAQSPAARRTARPGDALARAISLPVDGTRMAVAGPAPGGLRGRGQRYPSWVEADLAVPASLDARVHALAKRLGGGKDPADAAAAIERWLATALRYSRELPGDVADPIVDFLFARRAGHCELFSSAMVLMLRSLGIPARNVTGYFGGRRTDAGYYAVRAGDAHSWVEVYFPDAGYVPFDPTPASARGSRQEGIGARMVLLWDSLQQTWRAFVVDYDLVSQTQAMRRIGQILHETGQRLAGRDGATGRLRRVIAAVGTAVAAAAVIAWLRRLRLRARKAQERELTSDQRRAVALWRGARRLLKRAGVEIAVGTTPGELARRIPAAADIARAYAAARWGGAPLAPRVARAALRTLDAGLQVAREHRP